ncbi:energy transducer TonB [Glaciecola sp. XM2]|jgi:TonB family protein|uniref:energy transducer TonB n=1 Tax=Glaciecola sp. XM2 TaxID=1914931 RepID=UPI001BDEDCE2|nr:energy transducer TonB [Glaciecola sp. XM2]MBT1449791.1 energy transducer TonB [Glaciecola sp. XM2]
MFKVIICLILLVSASVSNAISLDDSKKADILNSPTSERWVELSFDITESGTVVNIKVIKSTHQGVFDKAAINALEKWKYQPKIVDGVAVAQKDMKVRLQFDIEDES